MFINLRLYIPCLLSVFVVEEYEFSSKVTDIIKISEHGQINYLNKIVIVDDKFTEVKTSFLTSKPKFKVDQILKGDLKECLGGILVIERFNAPPTGLSLIDSKT